MARNTHPSTNKPPFSERWENHPFRWLCLAVGVTFSVVISVEELLRIPILNERIEFRDDKIREYENKLSELSQDSSYPTSTPFPTATSNFIPSPSSTPFPTIVSAVLPSATNSTSPNLLQVGTTIPTTTPSPTPSSPSVEVNLPDVGFKRFIKKTLGKVEGPITNIDLRSIKSLEIQSEYRITDFESLQFCTNLQYLKITESVGIKQIDQISGLTLLTYLELENFLELENLSALSHLEQLTFLRVESHKVTDLSPLANLKKLSQLRIQGAPISDLTPLQGLTDLTYLEVSGGHVESIESLANLPNLQTVILYGNQITDIEPLVRNKGIGINDTVNLGKNPLNENAIKVQIEMLRDRLAEVKYEN